MFKSVCSRYVLRASNGVDMQSISSKYTQGQQGASVVEFFIAAPILLMMGLGTLQAGMLYHSKSILNYATFEAARVGATRHAMPEPMKRELGLRLAPLYGGDGTMEKAAEAMARSAVEVESPVNLDGSIAPAPDIKILNPTRESFEQWGVASLEVSDRTAIPNSHLKHQDQNAGEGTAAMTLADANLLKIQVTYGVELKIPYINRLILASLSGLENLATDPDPVKLAYYQAGRIPISSTATVRMQSEAWKEAIELANAPPPAVNPPDPTLGLVPNDNGETASPLSPIAGDPGECNEYGFLDTLLTPDKILPECHFDGNVGNEGNGSGGQSCV